MNMFWEGFTGRLGWALGELAVGLGLVCIVILAAVAPEGWSWLRRKF